MKMTQSEFARMSRRFFENVPDLTCGTELIAQDRAIVESESQGKKRLIPFIKTDEGWMFDLQTYRSFYQAEEEKNLRKM